MYWLKMENLPLCDIPMNDAQMFKFLGEQDYSKNHAINEVIKDLVGADCWAVVVNDKEVLFNSYTNYILNTEQYESFSYTSSIQESMIRFHIIDEVYSVIIEVFRDLKDFSDMGYNLDDCYDMAEDISLLFD